MRHSPKYDKLFLLLFFPVRERHYDSIHPDHFAGWFIRPENRLESGPDGLVIEPFGGSGTTGIAALKTGRNSIIVDNNPDYIMAAIERLNVEGKLSRKQLEALQQEKLFD